MSTISNYDLNSPGGQSSASSPAGTFSLYRPFGAASATTSGICGRLLSDLPMRAQMGGSARTPGELLGGPPDSELRSLAWSNVLEVDSSVDIRDGCTRTDGYNGFNYSDGDEIRNANGTRFVVVWVETIPAGPNLPGRKRAYLLRHSAAWPGP